MNHETSYSSTHNTSQEELKNQEKNYSPEELVALQQVAEGAENVLESAITAGEPKSNVVETDSGFKGYVESSVPGGKVEATFDGVGEGAKLEKIDMVLDSDDGKQHDIAIDFKKSDTPKVTLDGEQVNPEEIPAVKAVIENMQQEQVEQETDETQEDKEAENSENEVLEELTAALKTLHLKEMRNKSDVDNLMHQVSGIRRSLAQLQGRVDFPDTARRIQHGLEGITTQLRTIQRSFEVNEQEALALQAKITGVTGNRLQVVKESSKEYGPGATPPKIAERRLRGIDVRTGTPVAEIEHELRRVMDLISRSAPTNARALNAKIPRS